MAEKFDPYYKWLGIPPKDQPPHHYRLLGIELFEPDRDVIDSAANRLMSYLKELAAGDDASHSQKLLNEISRARLCLLNKDKKAAYDQQLREKLKPEEDRLSLKVPEAPPLPQIPQSLLPPAVEPPAFVTPPKVTEPPRIDVGPMAAQLDTRTNRPPPLKARGSPATAAMDAHDRDSERRDEDDGRPLLEPRRSSKGRTYLTATGLAAIGLAAVVIVILLLPSPGHDSGSKAARSKMSPQNLGPRPVLLLVLTEDERKEITEFLLDDRPQPLPPETDLTLEPGRHRLILRRTGYEEVFDSITLVNGVRREYRPRWRREVAGIVPPPAGAPALGPEPATAPEAAELPTEGMVEKPAPAPPLSAAEAPSRP